MTVPVIRVKPAKEYSISELMDLNVGLSAANCGLEIDM